MKRGKHSSIRSEGLVREELPDKLADIGKIMKRKTALNILKGLFKENVMPRKVLLRELDVSESVLSKYINKMKKVGLVDSERSGRESQIRVLSLGKNVIRSIHSKKLKDFFNIASDLNRILILESIHKNNGESTCKSITGEVNAYLDKNGKPTMDKDLLRYHLKELRKRSQIANNNRTYELTSEGSKTIKTILEILRTTKK